MPKISDAGRVQPNTAPVLDFMRAFCTEHGIAPTLDQTAAGTGMRKSHVYDAVQRLVGLGLVIKTDAKQRQYVPAEFVGGGTEPLSINLAADVRQALIEYAIAGNVAPETVVREAVAAYLGVA
jgi:DNA-binding IclR family transcriptional regulator